MTPAKAGKANEGHACVKGRFAFGYATHKDRIKVPMIRHSIDDPWREVSWAEAVSFAAERFKGIQDKYGRNSIGAISSSRCTNEEVYLVENGCAGFGNNNMIPVRVVTSRLWPETTLGESAGTQTFASVTEADVVIVMGANPTEAHPVFGSRLKRRLRQGARLIVIDPRKIELVSSPHIDADYHLPVRPGTNVTLLNALAYVVVSEELEDRDYVEQRRHAAISKVADFVGDQRHVVQAIAVDPEELKPRRDSMRTGMVPPRSGVTEHSQFSSRWQLPISPCSPQ